METAGKGRDEGGFEDGSHREGRGRGGVVAGGCGGFARRCVVDGLCTVCIKNVKK